MRIEDITREKLSKADDKELTWLKIRFMQIWDKHFKDTVKKSANGLDRQEVIMKYGMLLSILKQRKLETST
jgi:hypothetical protein